VIAGGAPEVSAMSDGDKLQVEFDELEKAAAAYKNEGSDIKQALTRFQAAANVPASAFGNLAESKQLASEYEQFFERVSSDMNTLSKALLDGTAKLRASAALYRTADEKAADRAKQIL
jgi:uncharacterized protein YukE